MNIRDTLRAGAVLLGIGWAAASDARAAALVSFTGGRVPSNAAGNNTYGFEIRLTQPLVLTHLGMYDEGGDGLKQSHVVSLWDTGSTPLASVTVPSGTSAALSEGFRYVALSEPLTLSAGNYVLGAHFSIVGGTFGDNYLELANSVSLPEGATFVTALHSITFFPPGKPLTSKAGLSHFGPGALYTAVPEPTAVGMGALLVFGVATGFWRRAGR